ncbi:DUF4194 domain-containing protein [Pseudomaricurvus alkylphenolicus]|uniref:DUF4194 domain-containing protein n=1 Tax=Pseudomaricurvus alkylphenolicus TaxID=1306991 RepID=UPI0014213BDB|nr:DUF4194 domain-containing protein [Pseudomaricurvus alkylphenolicus]NIB38681.1 DUF4194 domain-containing protein [Pseudomaricurvus alkylphenolicus]
MSIFDKLTRQNGEEPQPNNGEPQPNNREPQPNVEEPLSQDQNQALPPLESDSEAANYTPRAIKDACQELMRQGLIEAAHKPNLYNTAVTHTAAVNQVLEPLDLRLNIDDIRGLAFLVVAQTISDPGQDEWSHPLIRKQRLTLEQSLLLAILRQFYLAHEMEYGTGSENALVALADLLPQIRLYLGELGSEMAEDKRLRNILEKLKAHGVVTDVDKYDEVTVRPIITHLTNPENLTALLQALEQKVLDQQTHEGKRQEEGEQNQQEEPEG